MKPTFQNPRPVRRADSIRPAGLVSSKTPAVDWHFQTSAADLRGSSAASPRSAEGSAATQQSLYGLSQTVFAAETRWDDRIEAIVLGVVVAIAAWPIGEAIYIAARTV